ncbi:MAG TPA: Ig-like domain-containing protein [Edaphobacter sp.]|nr:Ig-like domain-containing protein [Edaphobacter sp.]
MTPTTQALTVGQTAQFTATGTFGNGKNPSTQNITSSVTWTSSVPSVATISAAGIATAFGAGTTTITASTSSFNGHVSSSATLTVTGSSGGSAGGSIASLAIIPSSQTVATPGQTTQFLAIGTTSSGATVNLSNQVAWSSSSPQIATIGATTGLATGVGKGSTTITAIYTNTTGGTVVTGTATFTVSGGATQQFTALSIIPSTQALSASGQTSQFIALGTSGTTGLQQDVTSSSQVKWTSSIPSIVSVSPTGLATGLSAGNSTITAVLTNSDGSVVTNNATVAVSITPAPEPLLSLAIIPSSLSTANLQGTGQFLAIGTYATPPYVRDLTNSPNLTWISSFPNIFTVSSNSGGGPGATAGIVTAYGNGSAVIIAEAKNPVDGTIQTATAQFNCPLIEPDPTTHPPTPGSCFPGSQAPALLQTLTVYNEGLNNTNWLVTASSASGTPNVLHCGPGWVPPLGNTGSVCSATYPVGTTVVLTAPAQTGVAFGGWSYNCAPDPVAPNPVGPNTCTISITGSNTQVSIGAIFNNTTSN